MNLVNPEPDTIVASSILRVLSGPARGGELATPADGLLVIGGSLDADVVLRGEGVRGLRLDFEMRRGLARLRVVAGDIDLLGQTISAPGEVILPPFVPFAAGDAMLAYGEIGHPRWADAQQLADQRLAPPAPVLPVEASGPAVRTVNLGERLAPALALALGGLLLGLAARQPIQAWLAPPEASPTSLARDLATQGFAGLSVRRTPTGPEVSGVVADRAAQARLLRWAQQPSSAATVRVVTNTRLSDEIAAAFRNAGIPGVVSATGLGSFLFQPNGPDQAGAGSVRQRLLVRDPAIRQLALGAGSPPGTLLPGQAGKQIKSATPGPEGSVLTVDGEAYFVGAELPGGGRLSAVADHQIVVERDGGAITIPF